MAYPGNSVGYKIFQEWNKFGLVALSFFIAVNNAKWNDKYHKNDLHSFRQNPRHFEKKRVSQMTRLISSQRLMNLFSTSPVFPKKTWEEAKVSFYRLLPMCLLFCSILT